MKPLDLLWSAYLGRLLLESGKRESEFLAGLSVQQGTFNRWKNGKVVPNNAAVVAEFARECGRNPLEAFVAAGMLSLDEAGRGLSAADREFLEGIWVVSFAGGQAEVLDPFGDELSEARGRKEMSGPSSSLGYLHNAPSAAEPVREDVEGDEEPEHP